MEVVPKKGMSPLVRNIETRPLMDLRSAGPEAPLRTMPYRFTPMLLVDRPTRESLLPVVASDASPSRECRSRAG
ncbi:hypothetical protein SBV1_940031 [Verrucomicrobia bacterium]|nr:hypothetical protein SBV1_940031 [Verrucomicrobiota bacterium]